MKFDKLVESILDNGTPSISKRVRIIDDERWEEIYQNIEVDGKKYIRDDFFDDDNPAYIDSQYFDAEGMHPIHDESLISKIDKLIEIAYSQDSE